MVEVPPDWFDAFPQQIEGYELEERVWQEQPSYLCYRNQQPDQQKLIDKIRVKRKSGQLVCSHVEKVDWTIGSVTSEVFRYADADTAANALIRYIRDERPPEHSDTAAPTSETDNSPDWFNTFPRQVGDHERGEMVDADSTAHLTYYRRVPDKHVPVDMVRITCEDGTYVAREQVKVHGRLRWQEIADSIVFQREADTAAADALVQYLLDGVDPDVYHNPEPNQVWPPEDLFTADTA